MIRMGRSSRAEQPEQTDYPGQQSGTSASYQYQSESQATSARAVTDSESMARDIKEGRLSGFVGHGTVLSGETSFQAMLRVDGHLVGSVSSDSGTLVVGANGQVDANVVVAAAMINGNVNGDIVASEKIQLGRTARVIGNIQTPRLILEDGAVFEGGCTMLKAREVVERQAEEAHAHLSGTVSSTFQIEETETGNDDGQYLSSVEDDDDDDEIADAASI
jgi:cytoskeletal protein CcmA (bactofilin family)